MSPKTERTIATHLVIYALWMVFASLAIVGFLGGCSATNHRGSINVPITAPDENGVTTGVSIWTPFNDLLPQHRGGPAPDLSSVPGPEVQTHSAADTTPPLGQREIYWNPSLRIWCVRN